MKHQSRKKPYMKVIFLGIVAAALYILLLSEQDIVLGYVSRGGMYAILPIVTAFIFSLVHGNFTGNFWTVIGIEAKKERR
ncbi:MAG: hypothetical protein SFH39_11665 [Candidatus Magnetobacterium sp. LHC-1]|uniref:Uncharacterized protein n=1 Tax=Candidatus Magnetobacterium casense TaxID=1455061 RepID=A0ABS6RW87_9BACT|nr:hypothetical protein [Candidatus Magnetobacterium casensis]MBF0608031.1 hypothetical protein [Nitrospirota bacterium]MBV6340892.1 hypothetical protein [Candidatus Magnetobacterium casensis]